MKWCDIYDMVWYLRYDKIYDIILYDTMYYIIYDI